IDDVFIKEHEDYFCRKFGQIISPEVSEEKDTISGDIVEVNSEGIIVPGGFFKNIFITPEKIQNIGNKNKLIGLKKEDKIILDNLSEDAFFEILELDKEKLKNLILQFHVCNISRTMPAELNQELFDKVYTINKVNGIEEFRNRIKEELLLKYANAGDNIFMHNVKMTLLEKLNPPLPEDFIKKYLVISSKKKFTYEQIDKEFHLYSDIFKWQLIRNNIQKIYNLVVTDEEMKNFIINVAKTNFERYGHPDATDKNIKDAMMDIMKDEKRMNNIYDYLDNQKLIVFLKKTFTLEKKEISYEEFLKISNLKSKI
ncbi:MAG: hypothetical protein V1781_01090, partial [Bacteroidota bacterium]